VAQHAAIAALTGPQEPVEEMYDAFAERRAYVADRVAEMEGVSCPTPNGAFYAFLNVDLPGSSLAIAKRLLREQDVVLAPGNGFGEAGEGKLRLSFASSLEDLETGLDGIERAVQQA
jgi:aspartate aminotransferase